MGGATDGGGGGMSAAASSVAAGRELRLEQLSVRFGAGAAGITGLSLTVAAGERLVVLGPSGAGKTTLLRAIAGLGDLHAGTVWLGTENVTALPPERRGIVYLHQSPLLFSHLDVGENVAYPLRVRGQRGDVVRQRVRAALSAVRLDDFERRPTTTLSGGQRHRVALARAIAARPPALLLDEPLSALDPTLRDEVRAAIVAAQAEYGPPMLLVTHDLDDAGLTADRIAVLLDGCLAQLSTPLELFTQPATLAVARFLGLFQEVPGRTRTDGAVECALGVLPAASFPGNAGHAAPVVVAIGPEALSLGATIGRGTAARVVAVRQRARGTSVVVRLAEVSVGVELEVTLHSGVPVPPMQSVVAISIDPRHVRFFPG